MPATVIASDEQGTPLGVIDAREAHVGKGTLHKAFSIYVFRNHRSEILIQRRSEKKMLWPLVWANTCCSHPREDEPASEAGQRRLEEELGFTVPLAEHSSFVYRAEDPSDRGVEHEYVTILVGDAREGIIIDANPDEVADWKWVPVPELLQDMNDHPDLYAPWFHLGLARVS